MRRACAIGAIGIAVALAACGNDSGGGGNGNANNNNNGFDPPLCGDGEVEGAEECDDGAQNTDLEPDACRTTCLRAHCGDSVLDTGEGCDHGIENSDLIPGACRLTCASPLCGDGVIDVTLGEGCDDGGQVAGDGCGVTCIDEFCTNGIVDPSEQCDDGNLVSGDGCSSDCRSNETCGNGVLDFAVGELCDCGASENERPPSCAAYNGQPGSSCTVGCFINFCGNGRVDAGEVCDDGNFLEGDGCAPDCQSDETCGNGRPDFFVGETCDCGTDPANLPFGCSAINGVPGSECTAACQTGVCGDGTATGSEVCDDGNLVAGDGCSPDCLSDETCGNGRPDFAAGETCDCGSDPGNLPPGCLAINGDASSPCGAGCQSLYCGNGVLDGGEVCDDGNNLPGDGCAPDCRSSETCGNGVPDFFAGEECDCGDGVGPLPAGCLAPNGDPASHCGTSCSLQRCGNGLLDPGEICDDGNALGGDGCSANCRSDESCGNGIRDPGEGCDDGNTNDGDGCSNTCARVTCGNGILNGAEACDDGNNTDGDGCSATCTSLEVCGNGIVDLAAGEECDDANTNNGDRCDSLCRIEACGNGRLDMGEACDDGNPVGGDGCSADCLSDESCGNQRIDFLVGEQCDDGDVVGGDGCDPGCAIEAGWSCSAVPSVCTPICGDGLTVGTEACDGADLGGQTCQTQGFGFGNLGCEGTCLAFDTMGCGSGTCPNGLCEPDEDATSCAADCTAISVDVGGDHSCAVLSDGIVRCWGQNTDGQLGDGTQIARALPVQVVGLPPNMTAVFAGDDTTCAVDSSQVAWCWGRNSDGELGIGLLGGSVVPVLPNVTGDVIDIDTQNGHTCFVVDPGGGVVCTGRNQFGQLGDGSTTDRLSPVSVVGLSNIVDVGTSGTHTCAVQSDGTGYCWGFNGFFGQLGNGSSTNSSTPVQISFVNDFTHIAAGNQHTCGRTMGSETYCWGRGGEGQLGIGSFNNWSTAVRSDTGPPYNDTLPGSGRRHSCAASSSGSPLMCWGLDDEGQLGKGSIGVEEPSPVITLLTGPVTAVDGGRAHTCAISAGRVYCWGRNTYGQVGDGTLTTTATPTPVLLP